MSDRLNDALRQGQKLIEQGDDADPAQVQQVLKAIIEEDRQGAIDAVRGG